jgi:5-oxoprolinase (ATP-hydrolysing) subunit A
MKRVDMNVDIGEGFLYDYALLEFATSANVCCGRHAGSWELTETTVEMCRANGVRIGIHPGFPERETMGRRMPAVEEAAPWAASVVAQTRRFWEAHPAAYLKPHGAWYNIVARPNQDLANGDRAIAMACDKALRDCVQVCSLPVMLSAGGYLATGSNLSVPVIREGFADRRYKSDGSLVPRTQADAVLTESKEIKQQVLELAGKVDSLCLHGDNPNCLKLAELVYRTLVDAGYEVGY